MRRKLNRVGVIACSFFVSAGWGGYVPAADEFINVPIVINIMNGADITEDQAKEAVKAANEIYKQAGIKFTVHKINTGVADPGGGDGSSLTREDRDKLRENGVNELPMKKGVKVTFAATPDAGDANVNGLTIHKTPCSICRKTARTGETMAHEIGHILTLSDVYAEGTEGRLMHGVFSDRTGTELTDAEKEEIKKEAQKRACKTEVKAAPETPAETKNNGGGLGANSGTLAPTAPLWQDVLMGQFTRIDPDPFYQLRLTSRGIVPPSNSWAYDVLFDTDADAASGVVLRGLPGIDARVFIQVSGTFVFGQLIRFNPPSTAVIPVVRIVEPEYVTVLTGEPREDPGSDVFEVDIPIVAMQLLPSAPVIPVHFVSGPNPSVNVDLVSLQFEQDQRQHGPFVQVFPPNIAPGDTPILSFFGEGFTPGAFVDLTVDDLPAGSAPVGPAGGFSAPIFLDEVFPGGASGGDYFFVTAQERSEAATFAYSVVHIDLGSGGGCASCAADYNQDGGVDGADVEAFFADWENGLACSDVNQDGGVDGADVEFFFGVWENGGCG